MEESRATRASLRPGLKGGWERELESWLEPERETMTEWGEERRENKEGQIGGEGRRAE